MKKLLLATAALLLVTASANAGSVVFGFEFDNGTIQLAGPFGSTQTVGPLDPFGGPFIVQQATGSTQPFVVPPDVLDTNTLDVVNTIATNVAFHIFVSAKDVPVSGLQAITSSFDSVGLTPGWTVTETSFIAIQTSSSWEDWERSWQPIPSTVLLAAEYSLILPISVLAH